MNPRARFSSTFFSGASAQALAKAILTGEHAVVYGARALAMPLRGLSISARLLPPPRMPSDESARPSMTLNGQSVPEHVRGALDDAMKLLHIPPRAFHVEGTSSIPPGGGLGGSAALSVMILRLLHQAQGETISPAQLAREAQSIEARFHGNPSGLDTTVVAMEVPVLFQRACPIEPIALSAARAPWRFAVIDSTLRASTSAMIERCAKAFGGSEGDRRIAHFDALTLRARDTLDNGDTETMAAIMNENQSLLDEIGAGHPALTEIIDKCRRAGAPAAKITGAGGGGAILVLLGRERDTETFNRLVSELHGLRVYEASL
jgi:mevalonate kinase